jgi:hypothetical protein
MQMLGMMLLVSAVVLVISDPPAIKTGIVSGLFGLVFLVWGVRAAK